MKEKCLIVFGGKSVEHDISIITAMQMKNFIEEDFVYVYIDKSGIWWTAENADDINIYVNFFKKAKKKKRVIVSTGNNILLVEKHKKYVPFFKIKSVLNCCHGNIGEDGALFEPVHGSAPDIAGQGIANPMAMLLSACMMLNYLKEYEAEERLNNAILEVLNEGKTLTPDLGGNATTTEVAEAIINALN